jgi:nucleotide-binding universal stress UspA family protein
MRRILVPTDFSPDAAKALELALELARGSGAEVTLLHVCEMPAYSFFSGSMYVPAPELVNDVLADARRALEQAKQRAQGAGVVIRTDYVERGDPATEIVAYARDHELDLIVMGTHGRRGFRRLILGSVAERVVRMADQPVLTTHAHAQAEAPTHAGAV